MINDVPLICDPVPGPLPVLITGRELPTDEADRFRRAYFGAVRTALWHPQIALGPRYEPRVGQRTEWPDAEYCAA